MTAVVLLVEEILHQLIGSFSHYLQGFIHPRWCSISSINSGSRGIFSLYPRVKIKDIKYTSTCPEIMKYYESFLKSGILLAGAANVNIKHSYPPKINKFHPKSWRFDSEIDFPFRKGIYILGFMLMFRGVSGCFFKFTKGGVS